MKTKGLKNTVLLLFCLMMAINSVQAFQLPVETHFDRIEQVVPDDFKKKINSQQYRQALEQAQTASQQAGNDSIATQQAIAMWVLLVGWLSDIDAKRSTEQEFHTILEQSDISLEELQNSLPKQNEYLKKICDNSFSPNRGVYVLSAPKNKQLIDYLYSIAITAAEKAGDNDALAALHFWRGDLCYYFYETNKVPQYYELVPPMVNKLNEDKQSATFFKLANYYFGHVQDMEKAEMYYKKTMDRKGFEQPALSALSNLYLLMGDQERALEYGEKLLSICGKTDSSSCVLQLSRSAMIYIEQGQYASAEKTLKKAAKFVDKLPQEGMGNFIRGTYMSAVLQLAMQTNKLDSLNMPKAIEMIKQLRPSEGLYLLIDAHRTLGQDKFIANNFMQLEWATQMPAENRIQRAFGDYFLSIGDYEKALSSYDLGLGLLGVSNNSNTEEVLKTQNDRDALLLCTRKLEALKQKRAAQPQSVTVQDIYTNALKAIAVLDKMRQRLSSKGAKERLLQQAPDIYETALSAVWELYEQGNAEQYLREAFSLSEKSRAILLLDALKEDDARRFGGVPDSLRQKESALLVDISYWESEVENARKQKNEEKVKLASDYLLKKREMLETLKKQLEKSFPKYFQLKYQTEVISVAQVQQKLPADAVLVEYFMGKSHYYVFAISKDKFWGIRRGITSETDINSIVNNWLLDICNQEQIKNNAPQAFKAYSQTAHVLYQWLLEDALTTFPANQYGDWIIIPDGVLSYIPFEILLTEAPKEQEVNYSKLPYFLRLAATSYHYSATLWAQALQSPNTTSKGILGIAATYANPQIPASRSSEWRGIRMSLHELNGAKEEVAALQKLYSGKYLFGAEATEAVFRENADKYGILHFAMHGVVNAQAASRSGLAFTEDGDTLNDNVLMAYEIPNMKLNADMVVLSACETARGKYQNGEGVMSIGRSFMYAGAHSVVMTLWEVNDVAAKEIVNLFYQHLSAGMPKHKALRQAKLDYLDKSSSISAHPFFWSPYVLLGNTQPSTTLVGGGSRIWAWLMGGGGLLAIAAAWWLRRKKSGGSSSF